MGRLEQQFRETSQPAQRHRAGDRAAGRTARAPAGRQHRARPASRPLLAGADRRAGSARQRDGRAGRRHARSAARRRRGAEELCAPACRRAQEKRSQIEVDLVRKQAELKFLDETSRKELNCPVEELAAADDPVPDADAIAEAEQACQRSAQPHRSAGRR